MTTLFKKAIKEKWGDLPYENPQNAAQKYANYQFVRDCADLEMKKIKGLDHQKRTGEKA